MTSPNGFVPDQAYVSGGSGQSGLSDLNDLTEGVAKSRMRAPLANSFGNQVNGFWGAVSGLVGAVVGGVTAVVNGIVGVINSIAGLFNTTRVDMGKVDKARADAENAIVENMSSSLEMLDEIQRFGGAYNGSYPLYNTAFGELTAEVVVLTHGMPLASGTSFTPPYETWGNYYDGFTISDTETGRGTLAINSGYLVLNEPGLWLIFFRHGVLQGNQYSNRPADLWCYVSPNTGAFSGKLPVGQPGFNQQGTVDAGLVTTHDRFTGVRESHSISNIKAFGRATSYVGISDTRAGGGISLSGAFPVYLEDGGYKVTMSVQSYRKFGGATTCNVFAYKVNTETLRTDIDLLKTQIAAALPGDFTELTLTDTAISAMVDEAANVEVDIEYNGN